jgi:tyrosyl-tRNA synthetase
MYGAIMAQPDEMIEVLFVNCTRIPLSEKNSVLGLGPREAKGRIAFEIVKKFYGEKKALAAQEAFASQFSKGELPSDIPEYSVSLPMASANIITMTDMASSKSEARRLISQGGVRIDGKVITVDQLVEKDSLIQVGKRKFAKIKNKKS